MNKKTELMVITMEECGELIQACSKILRHGNDKEKSEKWSNALEEEAGDVLCMLKLLEEKKIISWQNIENRVQYKREKLKKWSNIL